ncbi:AAA family ATPase [Schaedlerella arabinosiphila]|uniref:AAA family ATPase n=1 Tax=Schaedlerella arabinosiphila TaxID=2044587 RepID=UPI0025581F78|nr:AAA family ATPase [Schaedlerella arabinosiphila]
MARPVGIGYQDFEQLITEHVFYVDKTLFIKEWWENRDIVTLITRPRRFGKTLTMDMTEKFFSVKYANRGELFESLAIWEEEHYRELQGTYPVISLSFANIKEMDFENCRRKICYLLANLYSDHNFLLENGNLSSLEQDFFKRVSVDMGDVEASLALNELSKYLCRYYGKKVIILLDEYDTPLQEAYVNGYWEKLVGFTRGIFNAAFKTNPWLDRAIMTGITRVSKESIFSDLNNLTVVTTTSRKYEDCFGFTQEEVVDALAEYGLGKEENDVRDWYDGFTFGNRTDIYNPWSIINYLGEQRFSAYWVDSSSNRLVGKLIREGNQEIKMIMEDLLDGKSIGVEMDEQIVFSELDENEPSIWSLLLASGYLKVERYRMDEEWGTDKYELSLTNKEVRIMFRKLIKGWFGKSIFAYNAFVKALLRADVKGMNAYMNKVALDTISYFDTGKKPSEVAEPERFYHGFVLGLIVDLTGRYTVTSNRESGFGRYDVMLEPCHEEDDAMILEFKVYDPEEENTLSDTVKSALAQIEEKQYSSVLEVKGIAAERIRKYGFAFEGKKVLIG